MKKVDENELFVNICNRDKRKVEIVVYNGVNYIQDNRYEDVTMKMTMKMKNCKTDPIIAYMSMN